MSAANQESCLAILEKHEITARQKDALLPLAKAAHESGTGRTIYILYEALGKLFGLHYGHNLFISPNGVLTNGIGGQTSTPKKLQAITEIKEALMGLVQLQIAEQHNSPPSRST